MTHHLELRDATVGEAHAIDAQAEHASVEHLAALEQLELSARVHGGRIVPVSAYDAEETPHHELPERPGRTRSPPGCSRRAPARRPAACARSTPRTGATPRPAPRPRHRQQEQAAQPGLEAEDDAGADRARTYAETERRRRRTPAPPATARRAPPSAAAPAAWAPAPASADAADAPAGPMITVAANRTIAAPAIAPWSFDSRTRARARTRTPARRRGRGA